MEGLRSLGLTREENELVSRAKQSSDALIAQEEKAFEAAERKDFTKAMGYVYGEEYLKAKALIMDPIDEFRRRLDERLANQAQSEERAAQRTVELAVAASVLNGQGYRDGAHLLSDKDGRPPGCPTTQPMRHSDKRVAAGRDRV